MVMIRTGRSHLAVYDLTMLIEISEEVNLRLKVQSRYQISMPEDLI